MFYSNNTRRIVWQYNNSVLQTLKKTVLSIHAPVNNFKFFFFHGQKIKVRHLKFWKCSKPTNARGRNSLQSSSHCFFDSSKVCPANRSHHTSSRRVLFLCIIHNSHSPHFLRLINIFNQNAHKRAAAAVASSMLCLYWINRYRSWNLTKKEGDFIIPMSMKHLHLHRPPYQRQSQDLSWAESQKFYGYLLSTDFPWLWP